MSFGSFLATFLNDTFETEAVDVVPGFGGSAPRGGKSGNHTGAPRRERTR